MPVMAYGTVVLGGTITTGLSVILGVAALVGYFAGTRRQRPWGTPVLFICAIAAVGVLVGGRLLGGRRRETFRVPGREAARLLGRGLSEDLTDGARVVVLRRMLEGEDPLNPPMQDLMPLEKRQARTRESIETALESGAGVNVQLVGCEPVMSAQMGAGASDPKEFASILQKHRGGGIDAWISLAGLPSSSRGGLQAVGTHTWDRPPAVGADVDISYDPDVLRDYFRRGLLDAVVLYARTGEQGRILVTSADNLPTKGFGE